MAAWHRWKKALAGEFELPPEIGLMPTRPFYHPGENQLIPTIYDGNAQASGEAPDDCFKLTSIVNDAEIASTVEDSERARLCRRRSRQVG